MTTTKLIFATGVGAVLGLAGCSDPQYDTSTPQALVDSMYQMIVDDRPDMLPGLIYIEPRDIVFDDGVTEASAIGEVRERLSGLMAQLWRVTKKINTRFPDQVMEEIEFGGIFAGMPRAGTFIATMMSDPFGSLQEQRDRIVVEDLYDGTAIILLDDEPVLAGELSLIETPDGWMISLPIEAAQGSEYWPNTREEWSVIASMILSVENALTDFETELDEGGFKTLARASERAGRLIGESVIIQSIIYASMKDGPEES